MLITGGAGGIGAAIARRMVCKGRKVVIADNLDGVVYGIHACLPHLRGHGSIIVTSSLAGLKEAPDPFYAASKHALVGLARSTATLLAHDGVKVNALCPGLVDTPLLAPYREPLTEAGHTFADPDEAADAVEAILTDGRTGQAWIVLNGRPSYPARFPDVTTNTAG
ncbi:SDR family NAD(P)-dependent oxidoreductase [Nonomuraea sp. NPDC049129]|uniref:SDR family NAD(P)-dependent oxidoreductase n=1 Tax=Nonomuraea sp. NPDC049129 TaxID=3155272 RepID=UPI0033C5AAE2